MPAVASGQAEGVSQAPEQLHQRILVADDNAINLKVAQAMLAKLGHSTATAVNGVEAAELVAQSLSGNSVATPFAAVLMDANMPAMDGLQSTRLILLRHGTAAPPIIALTASVLEEDRQSCMDAGMQGFLAKPLRLDELGQALKRYAAGSQIAIKKGAACAVFIKAAALNDSENDAGNKSVLMDWSRLEQFRQFDDNALSMTREIVSLFIKDAPGRCTALQAALASSSSAGLSQAAHALKGSASNVGASVVQDACARLEQSCLQGTWPPDAASQIDCTSALCQSTVTVLQRWLRSCN